MLKRALLSIIFPAVFSMVASCSLFDRPEEIPAYIRINGISLSTDLLAEGSASHKIVDAWIYVDNELIGAFELPATIPVLTTNGSHSIRVKAGIKINGISALRIPYPFYNYYEVTDILTAGEITTLTPAITYRSSATFAWKENFDGIGHTFNDTITSAVLLQDAANVFEGIYSGHVHLNTDTFACEIQSSAGFSIPSDGREVFLELNYKSDQTFNVGVVTNASDHRLSLVINKSATWNKIYINLTNEINESPVSGTYKIYFSILKPSTLSIADLYIDNVKLVY